MFCMPFNWLHKGEYFRALAVRAAEICHFLWSMVKKRDISGLAFGLIMEKLKNAYEYQKKTILHFSKMTAM